MLSFHGVVCPHLHELLQLLSRMSLQTDSGTSRTLWEPLHLLHDYSFLMTEGIFLWLHTTDLPCPRLNLGNASLVVFMCVVFLSFLDRILHWKTYTSCKRTLYGYYVFSIYMHCVLSLAWASASLQSTELDDICIDALLLCYLYIEREIDVEIHRYRYIDLDISIYMYTNFKRKTSWLGWCVTFVRLWWCLGFASRWWSVHIFSPSEISIHLHCLIVFPVTVISPNVCFSVHWNIYL